MQNNLHSKLNDRIMQNIQKNNLQPKPKWLFAFKAFSLFTFILFLLAFSFYLFAFIAFIAYDHNWIVDTTFTLKGFYLLLSALPWTLLFSSVFMIFIASLVSRKYSLSYKKPFIYVLSIIISILFITNFIFINSGVRATIKQAAYDRGIKLAPSVLLDLRKDMQKMRIYEE